MITLALIVEKTDSAYMVNIPILLGRPDSETEVKQFETHVGIKKILNPGISDLEARQRVLEDWIDAGNNKTDWALFKTKAFVCAFPGSTNLYEQNDWVYVGFIDNSMSMPVILGHAVGLTDAEKVSLLCESKPSLILRDLKVEAFPDGQTPTVELPSSTVFKFSDDEMAVSYLLAVLKAFNNFAITVGGTTYTKLDGILDIIKQLAPLVSRLNSLLSPGNNTSNSNVEGGESSD